MKPLLVRIVRDWPYPADFFKQLPGRDALYYGVEFTEEAVPACDYLIVLQRPPYRLEVKCGDGNAWLITQEPPAGAFRFQKKAFKFFDKVFSYLKDPSHKALLPMQPVLPWHVSRTYDELAAISQSDLRQKRDELVWITGNGRAFPGHKARMKFKDYMMDTGFKFHLYGTGFTYIRDKFDGMFPCKYTLAIENSSVDHYWTEKLADSFLSWCLPFYWGAPNLEEYFPKESFIRIDITKPSEALKVIVQAMQNREWEKRLDALHQSRLLILNRYQFFPYVAEMIKKDSKEKPLSVYRDYHIPENPFPLSSIVSNFVTYYIRRFGKLFSEK